MLNCIRGQKLTSSSKPFVFIPTDKEEYGDMVGYVYKGPYKKLDKRNLILTWRIDIIKSIGTQNILLPRKIIQQNDDWFEFKFIGNIDNIYYREEHDNVSNTDVKILDREQSGFKQLSKVTNEEIYDKIFNEKLILGILDLIILGTGDMGLGNILVGYENITWIIDYEDTRPNEENDMPLEYNIFKRTSKANVEILKKGINNNKEMIRLHLENRKLENWDQWDVYWKYINRNPINVIDYILKKI
jgi:hypothetical protein